MCTAKATDMQVITQKDIGTAKREQKEHLRRDIKKAREAAEAADREIAALQGDQSTPQAPSPEAPEQQAPPPSKTQSGKAEPRLNRLPEGTRRFPGTHG